MYTLQELIHRAGVSFVHYTLNNVNPLSFAAQNSITSLLVLYYSLELFSIAKRSPSSQRHL